MKALFSTIIATVLFFNFAIGQSDNSAFHSVALSVPTVALVEVTSDNPISLTLVQPDNAGEWFEEVTNNSSYLNVTSVVTKNAKRTISVASGTIPDGLVLTVLAEKVSQKGNLGTAETTAVILGGGSENLITDIKTGYTNTGVGNGFQLTYSLSVDETSDATIESLVSVSEPVTVTYTISE